MAAARRQRVGAAAAEIVFATQFQTGRGLTDWRSLGAPGDEILTGPVIAVNQVSGSVHVLVLLRTGGIVRCSRDAAGGWGRWKAVTPGPYTGDFVALMPHGGPLEILAVGSVVVDRWVGVANGRFELRDRLSTPVVAGSPLSLETGPKRATYFWRYPGDDSLVAWRPPGQAQLDRGLLPVGGAGTGRAGAARALVGGFDCTVLAQRGVAGGIEVTAYGTENEHYGAWRAELGGEEVSAPRVVVDGTGRIVVAAVDRAGRVLMARQDVGQQGLAFEDWSRLG
ncbi:hypothetical protein AB0436_18400 [Streptomyces sp. NPDC051322]|uniref:hypothetical protein n=1 Tax=Streptomyces sp. NPDC051322 TaxID=3154645 RepID=UPI003450E566